MNGALLAVILALQPVDQARSTASLAMELPPPPEQVMALPESLRTAFREQVLDATSFPEARLTKLVEFVFDQDKLGVEYQPNATLTVTGAFESRKVNCLSSTLLVVALAREAGLQAAGQEVPRILTWGATGETVIQTKHANAIVGVAGRRRFVVDVDASDALATDALNPVSDDRLLALFYGNRAMELMVAGRLPEAKMWLDAAFQHAQDDAVLQNNAGVLSLRMGDPVAAERHFLDAVEKDPEQISVLSNLISFYKDRGDAERERAWQVRADKALRRDPYYQFTLGRQYEQAGLYKDAVRQYRRAIMLHDGEHRFHFALARIYFESGKYDKAGRELAMAIELADGGTRERYQGKLAALRERAR